MNIKSETAAFDSVNDFSKLKAFEVNLIHIPGRICGNAPKNHMTHMLGDFPLPEIIHLSPRRCLTTS